MKFRKIALAIINSQIKLNIYLENLKKESKDKEKIELFEKIKKKHNEILIKILEREDLLEYLEIVGAEKDLVNRDYESFLGKIRESGKSTVDILNNLEEFIYITKKYKGKI